MRRSPHSEQLYELIGTKVRRRRNTARVSQAQLARRCGYTRATVANVEAGKQRPTIHTLVEIARGLSCDYRSLLPAPEEMGADWMQPRLTLPNELQKAAEAAGPADAGKVISFLAEAMDARRSGD